METLLVRLKPHDARRGHVLRRYTKALDTREETESKVRRAAADEIKLSEARRDTPIAPATQAPVVAPPKSDDAKPRKEK
jgi:hypothetical protein